MPSYEGMIAAAMGARALRGFAASRQRQKAERGFLTQAVQMFNDIGSEEARKYAAQLQENPQAAFAQAEAFGGFEKMYEGMRLRSARRDMEMTMTGLFAEGSEGGAELTKREILTELFPSMTNAGIPNATGLVQVLLQNDEMGGNTIPKWFADRVKPADWTPASYREALQYGMQTGDWEEGALNKLKPRPTKDPNTLSPSQDANKDILRILTKERRVMEARAQGIPDDQIDFVSAAEEAFVNNWRKQADPTNWNKFERTKPSKEKPAPAATGDVETPETAGGWFEGLDFIKELGK
jgi:hypothetical protein